ncbi:MAG: HAD family hydrolase [Cytophagaceae bacterium]
MSTKAVIFDMDGVIVDNHLFHYRAWVDFCSKYDITINEEIYYTRMSGKTNDVLVKMFFGGNIQPEKVRDLGEEKEAVYRELIQKDIQPVTGLIPFLQDLKNSGIPLAVATNAPLSNINFTLQATGTQQFFSKIIDASMVSKGKPSPEIYLKAASELNTIPENCLVFEDSFTGIEAARAAGMKVAGVATTHKMDEISRLTDITIIDFTVINAEIVLKLII